MKIISNWIDYVVEGTDIDKLEQQLMDWLDDEGNLILIDELGEDYTKQFWNRYDIVFHEEILK